MPLRVVYADEFVKKFGELTHGQQGMVQVAITKLLSEDEPTSMSHHLERASYFCSWSHRVRGNLLVVFRVSRGRMIFLSTGTHAQSYRPRP